MKYDLLVNFEVESPREEEAERQLLAFLKLSLLDFGLTYDIKNAELVEFSPEEGYNS